jgi:TIR domain/Effector-associated domain 11
LAKNKILVLPLGRTFQHRIYQAAMPKSVIFTNFLPNFTRMKEQIQQLIANGQTEDALALLAKANKANDAMLLQAQYNNGKRNFNMGLIDFSEWGRIQARVNFAALELAGQAGVTEQIRPPRNPVENPVVAGSDRPSNPEAQPSQEAAVFSGVFISYNHDDRESVDRIRLYLEQAGLSVAIDTDDMAAGQAIKDFIQNRMREKGFILSVVSKNSLQSGWVGIESDLAFYSQLFGGRRFLPVRLDSHFLNDEFLLDTVDHIDLKLSELDAQIAKAKDRKISALPFESKRNRLQELRENLPKILDRLQNVLTVDVSEKQFEIGMKKVVETIKGELKG